MLPSLLRKGRPSFKSTASVHPLLGLLDTLESHQPGIPPNPPQFGKICAIRVMSAKSNEHHPQPRLVEKPSSAPLSLPRSLLSTITSPRLRISPMPSRGKQVNPYYGLHKSSSDASHSLETSREEIPCPDTRVSTTRGFFRQILSRIPVRFHRVGITRVLSSVRRVRLGQRRP